jgi:hypothetical protein
MATAVLAAMGFLDALSSQLDFANPGWALTMIAVLNAAQTVAAIAVLVVSRNAAAGNPTVAGYEAYAEYYSQAVRDYYSQQAASAAPEETQAHGYGQATSGAQVTNAPQRIQRPPQHAEYAEFVSPQSDYGRAGSCSAESERPATLGGLPRLEPAQPPTRRQEPRTEQSVWPPSP